MKVKKALQSFIIDFVNNILYGEGFSHNVMGKAFACNNAKSHFINMI